MASGMSWMLGACALTAGSAAVLLVRCCCTVARVPRPDARLAWWIRALWRAAQPLVPVCAALCPSWLRARTGRRLASADLAVSVPAERWLAMRCVVAGLAAAPWLVASGVSSSAANALIAVIAAGGAAWLPQLWLTRRLAHRARLVDRQLPAFLDLLTVSVEAGAALTAGIRLIVERSPPGPLRNYFEQVLREIRGGRGRSEAFAVVARVHDIPALTSLATALAHGEASGMSLGNVLRAQSAQRTAERFAAAEKLAMQAPVKLLGPLILCIFPCTFVVLAVPIVFRLREAFGS